MDVGLAASAGAGVALATSAGFCALVAWAGPLDSPRARGSHTTPTVTSGGLAVIAGASLGLIVFALLATGLVLSLASVAMVLGFAGALGLFGALDDLVDLGAKGKLIAQAVVGLLFVIAVQRIEGLPLGFGFVLPLGAVVGGLGTALWLVVTTNAVNFMDGANGLAAGSLAIVLAALGAAGIIEGEPAVGALAFAGSAALAGFLPWNLLPGRRLFQGDAGALFSGFLAAGLAVVAAGPVSVYFAPMALTPFLTDVLLTLLIRARRKQSLWQAHRDHLYQLWLRQTRGTHLALAIRVWVVVGLYSAAALACEFTPEGWRFPLFALGVLTAAIGWREARRRLEKLTPSG